MAAVGRETTLTPSQAIVWTALIKELRERARRGGAATGLTVEELSKMLKASKSRVRAVLAELRREGLAESRPKPLSELGLAAPGRRFREKVWATTIDPLDDEAIRRVVRERGIDRILGERGVNIWELLEIRP